MVLRFPSSQGVQIDPSHAFSLEMMQTPLNVALAASPLFLLTNRMLGGVSLGKPNVLEVWQIFRRYVFL